MTIGMCASVFVSVCKPFWGVGGGQLIRVDTPPKFKKITLRVHPFSTFRQLAFVADSDPSKISQIASFFPPDRNKKTPKKTQPCLATIHAFKKN